MHKNTLIIWISTGLIGLLFFCLIDKKRRKDDIYAIIRILAISNLIKADMRLWTAVCRLLTNLCCLSWNGFIILQFLFWLYLPILS